MEFEIKNEAELEIAAIRIGQLKGALPGSREAEELAARMQAMILFVRQNAPAPDQQKQAGWNKKRRLLELPRPGRKAYLPDQIHIDATALAWRRAA